MPRPRRPTRRETIEREVKEEFMRKLAIEGLIRNHSAIRIQRAARKAFPVAGFIVV